MPTLNKMRALLLSPLIFGYSFIYPETWREFAESLDLIHPSQEIKKEEKFEKKIEQKIEEKKLEQIEEKKIEDVGIELVIDSSETTDDFVNKLNGAENIATLEIINNKNIDFKSITIPWNKLANLKKLRLESTNIDGKGLANFIVNCSYIENLVLDCEKITAQEIEKVDWGKLKKLKDLYLSYMKIEDAGLKNLIEKCPPLEALTIFLCDSITDEWFKSIDWTVFSKTLKELSLGRTRIGDNGLKKISETQFVNLIKLDLHHCFQITKKGFEDLSWNNLKNLKELELYYTKVSDVALKKILKSCESLETLDLEGCNNISETNRKKFKSNKEIKDIDI